MTCPGKGMADAGAPNPDHARLTELLELDQGARIALAEAVGAKGLEPGCWVRVDDTELISPADARQLIVDALKHLEKLPVSALADLTEFDDEHPWDPPDDGESAWIIISQSCDLVRDVRDEPLVQVALLRQAQTGDDLPSWSRNSARWIPLDPTGKHSRYYVDLRVQAFLAKHVIADMPARQAIPTDDGKQRPRTRFALRVGQRHSRMGIPTRIVQEIVDPLVDSVTGDKPLRAELDAAFSEWLLEPGERPALIAVTTAESSSGEFQAAEDLLYKRLWPALRDELVGRLDEERSRVVSLDDLTVPLWLGSWKVDLDFLTYGAKGPADSPEPHA